MRPETKTKVRPLGGGHRLKGHDQFVALTEADQVAVQHIRQAGSLLVAIGAYLHDECAIGFAQVTVAAENALAVEGEADAVGQFCGAELATHV